MFALPSDGKLEEAAILHSMDCFCGCGTKVPAKLTSLNIEAANVALELLAWDKARSATPLATPIGPEDERLIARGAECFQALLVTLHGEQASDPLPECAAWLDDSFQARRERPEMTTKGSLLHRSRLTLNDADYARLDRVHPELSFSGHTPDVARPEPAVVDPVEQLKGLSDLHAAGSLTDEEFAAAKARVIGHPGAG